MTSRTHLERKQVDDVLGGEEMWKHADSTTGELFEFSLSNFTLTLTHGLYVHTHTYVHPFCSDL